MERPVARRISLEVDRPDHPNGDIGGGLGPLRCLRYPAAVSAAHRKMVTMEMNRMVGHREISHPNPHVIAEAHRHGVDAGKYAAVPGPHVEVGHFIDLRQICARIDEIARHDEDEITIDAPECRLAWMDDKHSHHAHR